MRIKVIPYDKKVRGYVFEPNGLLDIALRRYGVNKYGVYMYNVIVDNIRIIPNNPEENLQMLLDIAEKECPEGTKRVYISNDVDL